MTTRVITTLDEVPGARHVVTIGNFDGVHRGHQYLLRRVAERARADGVQSLVITFDPLPVEVLRPERAPKRLCTTTERLELISAQGIDTIVALPFDRAFSRQVPSEFVDRLVVATKPVEVVVGPDFAFGRDRAGNAALLRELGPYYGFTVPALDQLDLGGNVISSTRIRRLIAEGDVAEAEHLLGRPYHLAGTVEHGANRGHEIGYPTANLAPPEHLVIPADGIYAAGVSIDDSPEILPAMVYIGSRPTYGEVARVIEVNILDYDGDLYGHYLDVFFASRVREDQRFESVDAMVDQIALDEVETRRVLAGLPARWPFDAASAAIETGKGVEKRDR